MNCNNNCIVLGSNSIKSIPLSFNGDTSTAIISLSIDPNNLNDEDVLISFFASIPVLSPGQILSGIFKISRTYNSITTFLGQEKNIFLSEEISSEIVAYQFIDHIPTCENCPQKGYVTYLITFVSDSTVLLESIVFSNIILTAKTINSNDISKPYISKFVQGISELTLSDITANQALIPITIGSITLDLSRFKDPIVLLNYSGDFVAESQFFFTSTQNFNVIRYYNDLTTKIRANFITGGTNIFNSQVFLYQVCDENLNCCTNAPVTYAIDLLPGFISSTQILSIRNVVISAYVFEKDYTDFKYKRGDYTFLNNDILGQNLSVPEIQLASLSLEGSTVCNKNVLLTFSQNISFRFDRIVVGPGPFDFDPTIYPPTTAEVLLIRSNGNTSKLLLNDYLCLSTPTLDTNYNTQRMNELSSFQYYDKNVQCLPSDCVTYTLKLIFTPYIFPISFISITTPILTAFIC